MSWLSFAEPADARMMLDTYRAEPGLDGKAKGTEPALCTNPLNGGAGPDAPGSANRGTMVPSTDLKTGKLTQLGIPARCDAKTGLLMIGDPPDLGPYVLPGNNYHVYDVPLFWSNIREDVARRSGAWLAQHKIAQ